MDVGASVLIYGRDPVLLETRRLMLRRVGFRVITIAKLEELSDHREDKFRVLVLCHTLSSQNQLDAISLGEKVNRELKTIVMGIYPPDFTLGIHSRFISPFAGPEALSALVREAIWGGEDVWSSPNSPSDSILSLVLQEALSDPRNGWMYQNPDSDGTIKVTFKTNPAQ